MSLAMSFVFALGLFVVLGLITWAVVAVEMSRAALSTTPRTDGSRNGGRQLVSHYAD